MYHWSDLVHLFQRGLAANYLATQIKNMYSCSFPKCIHADIIHCICLCWEVSASVVFATTLVS